MAVFLTERGNPYSESAIARVFCTIGSKVKFKVTPHMLRHAYATYTLHGLREAGFKGNALLYLRDRLGHTSVQTTEIYLHLLEQIDACLMTKHEQEINALFRIT
jgi:site-specific recombinase XerD